ncbi:CC0125/CC1285 family lipoprotein [Ferrimonas sp.]|uniref:CC0125/CC1285 family lipoprotein n=1 Tax=Ferrimonas sp. TaxID=2080861 RepID=UPI003A911B4D
MRRLMQLMGCLSLALLVSACATSYDTEKSFWTFGEGFDTVQIAPDSWQISFVGNNATDRALARKYVLYKSAELCRNAGYPYFVFTSERVDRDSVGQFGVGTDIDKDFLIGSSSIEKQTSLMVEVTGLKEQAEQGDSRVYSTDYILGHIKIDG